jgi:hypothetical protein
MSLDLESADRLRSNLSAHRLIAMNCQITRPKAGQRLGHGGRQGGVDVNGAEQTNSAFLS